MATVPLQTVGNLAVAQCWCFQSRGMKRLWLISLLICCTWRVIYGQSVQYTSSEDISRETALSSDKKENILQTAGTPSEIVNPTPNWDVYEVLNDEVNVTQSIEYVKNIPVYHYWDVHRGGFRTGILGDKIIDKYPQFVTYSFIKNSTADPRDPISLINVTTIDTSSLFMHLLLVTQYMDQKSKNISQTIRVLEDQFATFDTKLNMWKNVTGDEWKTAAQLRAECTQKEIQIEMLGKRIEMVELRKQARLATLREYYQVIFPKRMGKVRFCRTKLDCWRSSMNSVYEPEKRCMSD